MADRQTIASAYVRIQESMRRGDWEAAAADCRELLRLAPGEAPAWYFLGAAVLQRGAIGEAEAALRRAVALAPQQGASWNLLGSTLYVQGRWEDAAGAWRQSLAANGNDAEAWGGLGGALSMLGRVAEAQEAYERSLELAPDRLETRADFGRLLCKRGQPEQALVVLRDVIHRDPRLTGAWLGLGTAHAYLGQWSEALAAFRSALKVTPSDREARYMIALALVRMWSLPEAETWLRQMVAGDSNNADLLSLLAIVEKMQGRPDASLVDLRRALTLDPNPDRHSMLLLGMQYAEEVTPGELLVAHRQWNATYAAQWTAAAPAVFHRQNGSRSLRLGFVSADFAVHPVGFLALPLFESLDKSACSVVCYCDRVGEDELTPRFRAAADVWRQTGGMPSDELAEQIRRDEIDVLFDLMGHAGKRLLLFAQKPAPLQVTWLGYVGTTGLAAMDYLLADRFHVREGEESWYTETVLRMPNSYACYGPPADVAEIAPLPALTTGRVTFGSFNNPAKYTPQMFDAWAEILRGVSGSQLLLKYGGLDQPQVQNDLRGLFAQRDIEESRIQFAGWSPVREVMASYSRVDLGLDTQPYSGGLTTCEALWMGVPVITFLGRTFAGRHSVSHMTSAGYPQFIADDLAGYIKLAIDWAGRLDELATIRAEMREQMRRSPLCNAPRFAIDFLAVVRETWTRHVHQPA